MDKANQALTMIAEGKISPKSSSYSSLKEAEAKMQKFKNNFIFSFLALVIIALLIF